MSPERRETRQGTSERKWNTAKGTSQSTDEVSAYIEEQLATMDTIIEMLLDSSSTATQLNEEIEVFKTE